MSGKERSLICIYCNSHIVSDEFRTFQGDYYHTECFDKKCKEKSGYPYPENEDVLITLLVSGKMLNSWKRNIQDRTGNNRSDSIKTGMRVYDMFLGGTLTGNFSSDVFSELLEIKSFLKEFKTTLDDLIQEKTENIDHIKSQLPAMSPENFEVFKEEILKVLREKGPQSIYTLPLFMGQEKRIQGPTLLWVLKKLEDEQLIELNKKFFTWGLKR